MKEPVLSAIELLPTGSSASRPAKRRLKWKMPVTCDASSQSHAQVGAMSGMAFCLEVPKVLAAAPPSDANFVTGADISG